MSKLSTLVCALLIALASSAMAADFYLEVEKSGRIYVFDDSDSYVEWQKSGDLGKATTRVGAGPKGETLVFMGELSRGMYEARHIPSHAKTVGEATSNPATRSGDGEAKWNWKNGKTTWESEHAKLSLSNRGQFRYSLVDPEEGDSVGSFRTRRMKTAFSGWFYDKRLTYKLQMNWASSRSLEDAILDFDFSGSNIARVRVGQYKVPFGRQVLTSSGKQQFVDRSLAALAFGHGYDIGVSLHGATAGKKFVWATGIFNGAGRNAPSNDNDKYQYVARVLFQPFGDVGLSESDFDSKDGALFAIGGGIEHNDRRRALLDIDRKDLTYGLEAAFKSKGLSAVGEYFFRNTELEVGDDGAPADEFDQSGFYVQGGYFIVPKSLEVAVRYGSVDRNTDVDDDRINEYALALNKFWNGHKLKLQGDVLWFENQASGETNTRYRVQMQWIF